MTTNATTNENMVTSTNTSDIRLPAIEYRPAWLGLRQGALTCVGWQVTLCDPIWQVTLRSSEIPRRAIHRFFPCRRWSYME